MHDLQNQTGARTLLVRETQNCVCDPKVFRSLGTVALYTTRMNEGREPFNTFKGIQ